MTRDRAQRVTRRHLADSWPTQGRWLGTSVLVLLLSLLGFRPAVSPSLALEPNRCPQEVGWIRLSAPEEAGASPDPSRVAPQLISVAASTSDGTLYASGARALYHTDDCGVSWRTVHEHPIGASGVRPGRYIEMLGIDGGGTLFAGVSGSAWIEVSEDYGNTWRTSTLIGPPGRFAWSPATPDRVYLLGPRTLIAGGGSLYGEAWSSDDAGRTWDLRSARVPNGFPVADVTDQSVVYLLGPSGVLRSNDNARSFAELAPRVGSASSHPGPATYGRAGMSMDGSSLWFISVTGDFLRSSDRGLTWQQIGQVPFQGAIQSLTVSRESSDVIYVVADGDELWAYREPASDQTTPP